MRAALARPEVKARYRQRAGIAELTFAQVKQHDGPLHRVGARSGADAMVAHLRDREPPHSLCALENEPASAEPAGAGLPCRRGGLKRLVRPFIAPPASPSSRNLCCNKIRSVSDDMF